MQKIEVVVRITKDHCPPQEQTIFEWFDLMRNPTDALSRPDLEINLEHHRVFKHGTEVYMSRYEYGVLSLMDSIRANCLQRSRSLKQSGIRTAKAI